MISSSIQVTHPLSNTDCSVTEIESSCSADIVTNNATKIAQNALNQAISSSAILKTRQMQNLHEQESAFFSPQARSSRACEIIGELDYLDRNRKEPFSLEDLLIFIPLVLEFTEILTSAPASITQPVYESVIRSFQWIMKHLVSSGPSFHFNLVINDCDLLRCERLPWVKNLGEGLVKIAIKKNRNSMLRSVLQTYRDQPSSSTLLVLLQVACQQKTTNALQMILSRAKKNGSFSEECVLSVWHPNVPFCLPPSRLLLDQLSKVSLIRLAKLFIDLWDIKSQELPSKCLAMLGEIFTRTGNNNDLEGEGSGNLDLKVLDDFFHDLLSRDSKHGLILFRAVHGSVYNTDQLIKEAIKLAEQQAMTQLQSLLFLLNYWGTTQSELESLTLSLRSIADPSIRIEALRLFGEAFGSAAVENLLLDPDLDPQILTRLITSVITGWDHNSESRLEILFQRIPREAVSEFFPLMISQAERAANAQDLEKLQRILRVLRKEELSLSFRNALEASLIAIGDRTGQLEILHLFRSVFSREEEGQQVAVCSQSESRSRKQRYEKAAL